MFNYGMPSNGMLGIFIPGMNYQQNLMFNPSQYDPNIIQQYKSKISQLESKIYQLEKELSQYKEIIIKKDLEINSLKNNNIRAGFNQLPMQYMNQQFNNNNNKNNIINVINPFLNNNMNQNINNNQNNNDTITIMIQSNIKKSNINKTKKASFLLDILKKYEFNNKL